MELTNQELISIAKLIYPRKKFKVLTSEKGLYELVDNGYRKYASCRYNLIQIDTTKKTIYTADKSSLIGIISISYLSIYKLVIEYIKATRATNLLMEYWDSIPDDEKPELNKKLTKLGF